MSTWPTQTKVKTKKLPRPIINIIIIIYCLVGTIHHFGRTLQHRFNNIMVDCERVFIRHNKRNTLFSQVKNVCFA